MTECDWSQMEVRKSWQWSFHRNESGHGYIWHKVRAERGREEGRVRISSNRLTRFTHTDSVSLETRTDCTSFDWLIRTHFFFQSAQHAIIARFFLAQKLFDAKCERNIEEKWTSLAKLDWRWMKQRKSIATMTFKCLDVLDFHIVDHHHRRRRHRRNRWKLPKPKRIYALITVCAPDVCGGGGGGGIGRCSVNANKLNFASNWMYTTRTNLVPFSHAIILRLNASQHISYERQTTKRSHVFDFRNVQHFIPFWLIIINS